LPDEFREVLAYLVKATEHDPSAHCEAVTEIDLYHLDPQSSERIRSEWAFLWNVLVRMENQGLVVRSTMREDMIGTPNRPYTVARITDAGREAHRLDQSRRKRQPESDSSE
jgi:hypothetical protein